MEQELLLLILLHWVEVVVLLFLEQHTESLGVAQVNHVVLVAPGIPSYLLVWGVPPVAVDPELVLVSFGVQKLGKPVSGWLLADPLKRLSEPSADDGRVCRDNVVHLLALPVVELRADFDVFTSKAPLEDVLDLVEQDLLLLDHVHVQLVLA